MASTYDAVVEAGGNMREVMAAIEAQPLPHLVDRLEGFAIQLPPGVPGGERVLRVTFAGGMAEARLLDTALTGRSFIESALADRTAPSDWAGIEAFMRRHGVALEASIAGRTALLDLDGPGLRIRERASRGRAAKVSALITFCSPRRSVLVEASLEPEGRKLAGLNWVRVEHGLAMHGITLKPVLLS